MTKFVAWLRVNTSKGQEPYQQYIQEKEHARNITQNCTHSRDLKVNPN